MAASRGMGALLKRSFSTLKEISNVTVIGSGLMGSGIAQVCMYVGLHYKYWRYVYSSPFLEIRLLASVSIFPLFSPCIPGKVLFRFYMS